MAGGPVGTDATGPLINLSIYLSIHLSIRLSPDREDGREIRKDHLLLVQCNNEMIHSYVPLARLRYYVPLVQQRYTSYHITPRIHIAEIVAAQDRYFTEYFVYRRGPRVYTAPRASYVNTNKPIYQRQFLVYAIFEKEKKDKKRTPEEGARCNARGRYSVGLWKFTVWKKPGRKSGMQRRKKMESRCFPGVPCSTVSGASERTGLVRVGRKRARWNGHDDSGAGNGRVPLTQSANECRLVSQLIPPGRVAGYATERGEAGGLQPEAVCAPLFAASSIAEAGYEVRRTRRRCLVVTKPPTPLPPSEAT